MIAQIALHLTQTVTSFGLIAVSAWFASERMIYNQHSGQKWLGDVISEFVNRVSNLRIVRATRIFARWLSTRIVAISAYVRRLLELVNIASPKQPYILPSFNEPHQQQSSRHLRPPPHYRQNTHETISPTPRHETARSSFSDFTERPISSEGRSDESIASGQSDARQRFVNAIRSVIMLQSTTRPMSPRRDSSWETPQLERSGMSPGRFTDGGVSNLRNARTAHSIEKLKLFAPVQELAAHQALVRHLQFSPNGKYLATSRYGLWFFAPSLPQLCSY